MLDREGTRALFGRDGKAWVWVYSPGAIEAKEIGAPSPRALAVLPDGRLVACVAQAGKDGRERTVLALASVPPPFGPFTVGERIALPALTKIKWPGGIWAKNAVPWPESEEDVEIPFEPDSLDVKLDSGFWQGEVRLDANRFGLVVTSSYDGAVVLFDPTTLAPKFGVRLPTDDATAIHGVATQNGVLVVETVEGRQSAILMLGEDGSLRAHKAKLGRSIATGLTAPLLVGDRALVTHDASEIHQVRLPELETTRIKDDPFGGDRAITAFASTPAGDVHVIAIGDPDAPPKKWELHRLTEEGAKLKTEKLHMPDLGEPEPPPEVGSASPRTAGAPSFALVNLVQAWNVAQSEVVELRFKASNKGGKCAGVYVEISGPALPAIEAVEASAAGQSAQFAPKGSALRAELSGVALDAGFIRNPKAMLQPPPDPNVEVTVRLRGAKVGQALLMVRVGPMSASGSTGSAMEGRTLVIR